MAGETGKEVEPEIIEIIENVLDNQMFALAVIAGVVGGAILAYLYFTREQGQGRGQMFTLPHIDNDDGDEPVEAYQEGQG